MRTKVRNSRFWQVIGTDADLEQIATGFRFLEGPVWHSYHRHLTFSDILGNLPLSPPGQNTRPGRILTGSCPLFDYPLHVYLLVALVMFMIGMSKGGFGAMLSAITVPLLALVLPVKDVIGMMPPVLMLADLFAVSLHWKKWNKSLVFLLIPASLIGLTIGTLFLASAPGHLIRIVLGVIMLLFAIYKLLEKRLFKMLTYTPRKWHGLLAGSVAGFTSSVSHSGGPPIGMYLLLQDLQPRVFTATSALFFLILNYIKIPFYLAADVFNFALLWQLVWLLPMVPLGIWAGKWMVVRVSKDLFDRIILVLMIISSVLLVCT